MMISNFKKNLALVLLWIFFLPVLLKAQKAVDIEQYQKLYPNEDVVQLDISERMEIKNKSNGVEIISYNNYTMLYLTKQAHQHAIKYITYYDYYQKIFDIKAHTLSPVSGNYKKSAAAVTVSQNINDRHFYDDQREYKLIYPSMQQGAITKLSYKEKIYDPHTVGNFTFQRFIPVENARFELVFPSNVKIKYLLKGENTSAIKFSKKEEGKNTVYIWECSKMPKLPYEEDAPSLHYQMPHLIFYIEEINNKKNTIKVFGDAEQLHKYYLSLIKEVEKVPDAGLKSLTDSIIRGADSDYEKTRRIYYWVQDHIRYVAFEDGLGGVVPRNASAVCSKRFGDCKDMANLMVVMLNYCGISAWHSWIGTRDIPYSYSEIPTNAVDNHMITAVNLNGEITYLDATGGHLPIGLPTPMIQGKQTLLNISDSSFQLDYVPIIEKEINSTIDTTFLEIIDDVVYGKSKTVLTGFEKFDLCNNLSYYGPEKQEENLKNRLSRGNNKCSVTKVDGKNIFDRDLPTVLSSEFELPMYVIKSDNELYVNLSLDKLLKNSLIDTAVKKLDFEFDYKYVYNTHTILTIPEGYKLISLPKASSFEGLEYGYKVNYTVHGNKVFFDQYVYIDTLILQSEKYENWNKMIENLQEFYRQTVVLKK